MASSRILREIAELSNPSVLDYDPEDIVPDFEVSDSIEPEDINVGREHYVQVSKSRLKGVDTLLKDERYRGRSAKRKDLFEGPGIMSDSQDEASEDDEAETNAKNDFEWEENSDHDGMGASSEDMSSDSGATSNSSDSENEQDDGEDGDRQGRRDKVRQLLAQENKTVAEQLSESAQADAEKGHDIKTQQRFYDGLLDARIRIQKSIVSLNSLPQSGATDKYYDSDTPTALVIAKEKAYTLFLQTFDLKQQLLPNAIGRVNLKRKFEQSSMAELLEITQATEEQIQPWRDEILTKWSDKVKAASGLPINKKFKALNQSIIQQLRENLSDKERLIERTRTKRANFNVLGRNDLLDEKIEAIDAEIFDDFDFYHPLLKDLVERKSLDIPVDSWNRQSKVRKNVKDTRASKGRKLRYHEHEKIQNFMAPVAAGTWHEDQIDELFSSLLGRRIHVDEDEVQEVSEVGDLKDGLRIFG